MRNLFLESGYVNWGDFFYNRSNKESLDKETQKTGLQSFFKVRQFGELQMEEKMLGNCWPGMSCYTTGGCDKEHSAAAEN